MRRLTAHSEFDRRKFLSASSLATAGLALSSFVPSAYAQDRRLTTIGGTVATRYGRVRGLLKDGVHQFFSVPYGAPTGGENRFMPPQTPQSWTGVNDHFEIRYAAPLEPGAQEPSPVVTALNRLTEQSEDCLTINVFTPGLDNKPRPVMVWMHGGGFSAGSGNYLLYDGTNLAKKEDVVVVSVNHRLNIFGFLHLADLGGSKWSQSTNVGLQDLVASLQWVKDNIENFGGDPNRVTIFGQSGGGGKTSTLMATPSAEGLFHRAIAQSGSSFRGQTASIASDQAEQLLRRLGLRNNQLDDLQELNYHQIQDAYYAEPALRGFASGPVLDGDILPRNQWVPTAPAYSANVPFMVGSTETENGWVGPPEYDMSNQDMLDSFTNRIANGDAAAGHNLLALYQRTYPERRNRMLWLTAQSDDTRRFNAQALSVLKNEQEAAPAYLYFFNWHSPVHNDRMGAYHTLDIPFVFYNMDLGASMTGSNQDRYQLSHVMSAAWAAFARTGNPNHADMPHWPEFNPSEYPTMVFGDEIKRVNDPNQETRLAIEELRRSRAS